MKPAQRSLYFHLWSTAAIAQGWSPKDDLRRRQTTVDCMAAIHREILPERAGVDSTSALMDAEVTALFVLLTHLGAPADPVASARWLECQADYRDFNLARNADWFQAQAGYRGKSRITRDRFSGRTKAEAEGFSEQLRGEALRQRVVTMSCRARRVTAKARADAAALALKTACSGSAAPDPRPCEAPAASPPDEGNPFF